MPESTLALRRRDFEVELAGWIGYGPDPDGWTAEMAADIDRYVKAGLAEFYFPDLGGSVYEWTFLKPYRTFALASGETDLDLPDDFNGFADKSLSVTDATGATLLEPVRLGWNVRQKLAALPGQTGPPRLAEVEVARGVSPTEGTRYRLLVFPEADRAYTLGGCYSVAPNALDGTRPYVYGGPAHAQTVKWAILAVAEIQKDNLDPRQSPNWQMFQSRLRASVAQDRRNAPKTLGYNSDRSGVTPYVSRRGRAGKWWDDVTIDGQAP